MAMLENVFEFLFKYRPIVYEKGRLAFTAPWSLLGLAAVAAVAVGIAVFVYSRSRLPHRHDRALLIGLRVSILGLLLFCILRPTLLVPTVIPQRNFLGILIDDSRSMAIADRDGETRREFALRQFGGPDSALYAALSERFMLRFYRFAAATERLDEVSALSASGAKTDLAQALDVARRELAAVPLAGLVLVSDGADNAGESLTETLLELSSRSIPVYPIGVGRERFDRDIEIGRVATPRSVLRGSAMTADLVVRQHGYSGQTVRVDVEDAGRIIASKEVRLPADGEPASVNLRFTAEEPGPRSFRFRIAPQDGERVIQNNEREALIQVEENVEKILYFEGEPRFEVKFIRRAVREDGNLRVVTLQRTAENKYLRLDVENAAELAGGFPSTREELFAYRGLILGSAEASFFSHDQLRMIEEFVSQRGGGLLVLGSRHSFARGGFAGTPLADVMPVRLPAEGEGAPEGFYAELKVEPTRFGVTHPATQIAATPEASAERWRELPAVSAVNRITEVKPGASVLLTGYADGLDDALVVLAYQRYGRGKALALPIQDSWTWQMHAEIPLEDQTHEVFWRQLLRWLVSYVPDRVRGSAASELVGTGDAIELRAQVQDETYLNVNDAAVSASITTPSGRVEDVTLRWVVEADGEYLANYEPSEEGLHEVHLTARDGGRYIGDHTSYFKVAELPTEYFNAELRRGVLERIADETGGRFYRPETVASLPEDVSLTDAGTTIIEERDLWDMPLVFFLLLGLIAGEWSYRRWRGLV